MNNQGSIKEKLYKACIENVELRLHTLSKIKDSIEESRNNQTKSSAGDKYETGRAMMQIEDEKNKRQALETYQTQNVLKKIDLQKISVQVELGSLVSTNKGSYYISIGLGKITIDHKRYYCISINSPIGSKLLGKRKGDVIKFNGSNIEIQAVS